MKIIFSKNVWNGLRSKFSPGWLFIKQNKIAEVQFTKPKTKSRVIDYDHLYIGPSAIDLHVHARDFLESHKETFESIESSAMKGGVSCVVCMANTKPARDRVSRIHDFEKRTKKKKIQFLTYAAVTKDLAGNEDTAWEPLLKIKSVVGLSDDGKSLSDPNRVLRALRITRKHNKILALHEEDLNSSKGSQLSESPTSIRLGIEGCPEEAESDYVLRDLRLAEKANAPVHLCHISSKKSLGLIKEAKRRGVSVSAELTPHHGLLTVCDLEALPLTRASQLKVCPVIRSAEDRQSLWRALQEGVVDCFASDHAPHSRFEKDVPYEMASHGLVSLEYFFILANEIRLRSKLSWKRFFDCLSTRPAQLIGAAHRLSALQSGYEASFVIFDPNAKQRLQFSCTKSHNAYWQNQEIRGRIVEAWISGEKVYEETTKRSHSASRRHVPARPELWS